MTFLVFCSWDVNIYLPLSVVLTSTPISLLLNKKLLCFFAHTKYVSHKQQPHLAGSVLAVYLAIIRPCMVPET
jgi:hypothetical protein